MRKDFYMKDVPASLFKNKMPISGKQFVEAQNRQNEKEKLAEMEAHNKKQQKEAQDFRDFFIQQLKKLGFAKNSFFSRRSKNIIEIDDAKDTLTLTLMGKTTQESRHTYSGQALRISFNKTYQPTYWKLTQYKTERILCGYKHEIATPEKKLNDTLVQIFSATVKRKSALHSFDKIEATEEIPPAQKIDKNTAMSFVKDWLK